MSMRILRKKKTMKKNHTEILELQNTIIELEKNPLGELNNRLNQVEERISKLEDKTSKIIKAEKGGKKREREKERS